MSTGYDANDALGMAFANLVQRPVRKVMRTKPDVRKGETAMFFGYQPATRSFHELRNEVDRLLTGFLSPTGNGGLHPGGFRSQPAINVWEQNDALKVEMEVPGVKSENLEISVAGGELRIKIDHPGGDEQGVVYHRRERPVESFSRAIRLPIEVNADRVEADLRDGVLTVTLPKAESAKPRKININAT
jgi:HSP20 family protein